MILLPLREQPIPFPSGFPFTLYPVGKRRLFLPTESRIIPGLKAFHMGASSLTCRSFFVLSLLRPQHSILSPLFRSPDTGRNFRNRFFR